MLSDVSTACWGFRGADLCILHELLGCRWLQDVHVHSLKLPRLLKEGLIDQRQLPDANFLQECSRISRSSLVCGLLQVVTHVCCCRCRGVLVVMSTQLHCLHVCI